MHDDLPQDALIADKKVSDGSEALPFKRPRKFHHIPESVTTNVGTYMNLVIRLEGSNREVDVTSLLEIAKKLFSKGRNDYGEEFWLQIAAAALREMVIFLNPEHFKAALPHLPLESDPRGLEFYSYLGKIEDYLSKLVHYKPLSARTASFRVLYSHDEEYSRISEADYHGSEGILFEEVCIALVYTLHEVLANHRNL